MEIVTQEVKTLYSIQFTVSDFAGILFKYYREMEDEKCAYPKAFEWLDLEKEDRYPSKLTENRVLDILDRMFIKGNGDTYAFIAKYFGFDGWSNGGLWNKNKKVWEMGVYNRGRYLK